jgi:isopentenyl diphosphate isomerase/L-lactate dehydrogenase-like FMN-dependent dehydrogenase
MGLRRYPRVARAINVYDVRESARWLPKSVFDAIDGGSGEEITLRANTSKFDDIWFRPRSLVDVSTRDTSTTVFGHRISMPLMLAPCGFARVANSQAELAVARAAGAAGTIFAVSHASSYPFEEVAAAATGPLWCQLYLQPDRDQVARMLERAEAAGYEVLCVTIDEPLASKRERDIRNNLTIPLKLSPRTLMTGFGNPRWAMDFALGNVGRGKGHGNYRMALDSVHRFAHVVRSLTSVTADDVAWLRERWPGKLVLKGVMRADECEDMVALGADGLVVSNHGGRCIDGTRASIEVLPEVVDAVGGRVEIFLDGGVRRGSHVVKAVALGATAVLVGRPYMFGLAAGGEAGVARVLEIFRTEIEQTMGLLGCPTIADVDRGIVQLPPTAVGSRA